jgi:cytochrome b6-f complex iron-sulfur subunit
MAESATSVTVPPFTPNTVGPAQWFKQGRTEPRKGLARTGGRIQLGPPENQEDLMSIDAEVSRRAVIVVGAGGAGAALLAACSSSGNGAARTSGAATNAGTTRAAATTGAPRSAASSGAAAGLVKLSDIQVGQAVSATVAGKPAIIARPTSDTAAAFSAICTHMGCTVAPAGTELHCPCHGSKYNATTGEVIQGPAPRALAKIDVHVVGGEVVAGT